MNWLKKIKARYVVIYLTMHAKYFLSFSLFCFVEDDESSVRFYSELHFYSH